MLTAVAAAASISLAVAACGGSGSVSHKELVDRANLACGRANHAAAGLGKPAAGYSGLAQYARRLSPIAERLIADLTHLKAGPEDQIALARYVRALRADDRGLALLSGGATPEQARRAATILQSQSIPHLADALGARTCAASPTI